MIKHGVFPASLFPLLPILHTAADKYLLRDPGLGNTSRQPSKNSGSSSVGHPSLSILSENLILLGPGTCEPWSPNGKWEGKNSLSQT